MGMSFQLEVVTLASLQQLKLKIVDLYGSERMSSLGTLGCKCHSLTKLRNRLHVAGQFSSESFVSCLITRSPCGCGRCWPVQGGDHWREEERRREPPARLLL